MSYTIRIRLEDSDGHISSRQKPGKPSSILLDVLTENMQYSVKCSLFEDGTEIGETTTEHFTTLPAGTCTLNFLSAEETGTEEFTVRYSVISTYALSSAVLETGDSSFQGTISGNTITFVTNNLVYIWPFTVNVVDIYGDEFTDTQETPDYLCFENDNDTAVTLSLTKIGNPQEVELEYKLESGNWTEWTESNNVRTVSIPVGEKVYIRGDNATFSDSNNWYTFTSNGFLKASGSIMSLLEKNALSNTITQEYVFKRLFAGMALTTAPKLPATTLAHQCYSEMFSSCTSLTTAPDLPASLLPDACYFGMFSHCTSLTTPPQLPSSFTVDNSSFQGAFLECTALLSPPDFSGLQGGIARHTFRETFVNCTSMTTPPDLSNVTSIDYYGCDSICKGCTSLTETSNFMNVTVWLNTASLTQSFSGCTNINKAYAPSRTDWRDIYTGDWLKDTAATGTLYASSDIAGSIPTDSSYGCPVGWTVVEV